MATRHFCLLFVRVRYPVHGLVRMEHHMTPCNHKQGKRHGNCVQCKKKLPEQKRSLIPIIAICCSIICLGALFIQLIITHEQRVAADNGQVRVLCSQLRDIMHHDAENIHSINQWNADNPQYASTNLTENEEQLYNKQCGDVLRW